MVGHSLGGAAVAAAIANGVVTDRAVLVAPAADLAAAILRYTRVLRLPDAFASRMAAAFEAGVVPITALQAQHVAPRIAVSGLVLHDTRDREIPLEEGERYVRYWPTADLVTTFGLGHRRILSDPDVIATAVNFIAGVRAR